MPDDVLVSYALKDLLARQKTYQLYADYLTGKQRLAFASDSFRSAFGMLFRAFAYNRCAAVVDAAADRLQIDGWETEGDQEDAIEKDAQAIWRANRMSGRQSEVHQQAFSTGDGYLIVWPDPVTGEPVIAPNKAHSTTVVYDDDNPGAKLMALKLWQLDWGLDAKRWRLTVYEQDRITRLISVGKSSNAPTRLDQFAFYEDAAGNPPEADNPFGRVPVFHLANAAETGAFGRSELADVIPLQDGLNKSLADMMVTGEFHSFPQRWAVGIEPVVDESGQEVQAFQPGTDRLWVVGSELAKFGQFNPADIVQFIAAQDSWDLKIARVSRTPVYWLAQVGAFPSGEALKTAEGPFVAKMRNRLNTFGSPWSDAMAFALEIKGYDAPSASAISPIWKPVESRSEQEFWQIAQLKAACGIPLEQIWAESGYSAHEIASFQKIRALTQQSAADNFGAAFGRGQTGA